MRSSPSRPKRSSRVEPPARYQRVKSYITGKIRNGSWKPGDRVPSEHELVELFRISRMTVNRALRELAAEGNVVRVAGVGTFVAEEKPQSALLAIANLPDEIRLRGHDYACEVSTVERATASLEVAALLGVRTGESVFHSVCVHRENGVPVQLEDRYVNPQVAPRFIRQRFDRVQPGEYLLRTVPYDRVEHVVDAIAASPREAKLLEMAVGQPCLLLTRRTWTEGTAVTLVRCYHPGDRYRLGGQFQADGRAIFG
jgi:GntR family histidine utilization transcriptional repressor